MMCQLSVVESKSATFPSEKARHLLDDSVLESRSPRRGLALTSSSAATNGLSLGKRPGLHTTAGGPWPGVCSVSVSVTVQHLVASHPRERAPCRSQHRGAFASWPLGFTGGPESALLLPGALSMAGRWTGGLAHTPAARCPQMATAAAWLLPSGASVRGKAGEAA